MHVRARDEVREQQLARAEDCREDVVEVVRDPSRQPPDRLELLRLPVLDLELPHFGQVGRYRQHAGNLSPSAV